MSCNSEATVAELQQQVKYLTLRLTELEQVVGPIYTFLNNKFGAGIAAAPQYVQSGDRNETGMGAIVSADRSSFI